MIQNISIIGGDLRIVRLSQMLSNDGIKIFEFGLDNNEILVDNRIAKCNSIDELLNASRIILAPLPLSKDDILINAPFSEKTISINDFLENIKNKIFIAGSIKENIKEKLISNNNEVIDLMKIEELTVLNTISTAEGTIQIAVEETERTIFDSNVLILGFGRVGKTLANRFKGIGANVYCEARKNVDLAWINTYGYKMVDLKDLSKQLHKFDIIINTIPELILDSEKIIKIKKDCLIIDLASMPGGVDMEKIRKNGIKCIHALALPGKVAPITSAEFIKDVLYKML